MVSGYEQARELFEIIREMTRMRVDIWIEIQENELMNVDLCTFFAVALPPLLSSFFLFSIRDEKV